MTAHAPFLRILRDPATLDTPTRMETPTRMSPAEIALTLSADVLRLPYTPATRLVLAEIVSLHAATGRCDASNPHFMARLTLKHDVVNEAIQRLHEEGLVVKVVNKAAGFYRTLAPVPSAIKAKAETNPYPEKPTSYPEKPTRGASRKSRLGYSEIPTSPSRDFPLTLVGNPDTNTPLNLPVNFQQPSTSLTADAAGCGAQKKIGPPAGVSPEDWDEEVGMLTESAYGRAFPAEPAPPTIPPVAKPPQKPTAPKPAKSGESAEFASFWQAWPKKEGKLDAQRAFAKLRADDQAAAASRADTWLAGRPDLLTAERIRYCPHASTWLNQQRWTDEAPAPFTANLSAHANASTRSAHHARTTNGAKPSVYAGNVAGDIAAWE